MPTWYIKLKIFVIRIRPAHFSEATRYYWVLRFYCFLIFWLLNVFVLGDIETLFIDLLWISCHWKGFQYIPFTVLVFPRLPLVFLFLNFLGYLRTVSAFFVIHLVVPSLSCLCLKYRASFVQLLYRIHLASGFS